MSHRRHVVIALAMFGMWALPATFTGLSSRAQTDPTQTAKKNCLGVELLSPDEGVDLTGWAMQLYSSIKKNWDTSKTQTSEKRKVVLQFRLKKDGTLQDSIKIEASSGKKPLDEAALAAIRAVLPLQGMPEGFPDRGMDLRVSFFYVPPEPPAQPPQRP